MWNLPEESPKTSCCQALACRSFAKESATQEDAYSQAAMLVSARAELEHVSGPEYHNAFHFSDVTAVTMAFLKRNNVLSVQGVPGAVKLSRQEITIGIIAAAGHDLDIQEERMRFPARSLQPTRSGLERHSVAIIKPLLRAAGIPAESIERITAILATSAARNRPRWLLNEIDRLHLVGQQIEWQTIAEHEKVPELRLLAEVPSIRVIAQNLQ